MIRKPMRIVLLAPALAALGWALFLLAGPTLGAGAPPGARAASRPQPAGGLPPSMKTPPAGASPTARTPAASDPAGRQAIRIFAQSGNTEFEWCAAAYQKEHPEVYFTYLPPIPNGSVEDIRREVSLRMPESFVASQTDLAHFPDPKYGFSAVLEGARGAGHGASYTPRPAARPAEEPKAVVYCYAPIALLAHPRNPLTGLSLAQLRTLWASQTPSWRDLGWEAGGAIELNGAVWLIQQCLGFDPHEKRAAAPARPVSWDPNRFRSPRRGLPDPLKAAADNPASLLIGGYSPSTASSGLKVLPFLDSAGKAIRPDDASAVASGRYPLRTPMSVQVHPRAGAAAREFAQWLTTPPAGEAMAAARAAMKGAWPEPGLPLYAHVSDAGRTPASSPASPPASRPRSSTAPSPTSSPASSPAASPPPARVLFAEKIEGAAAVLPTERLSLYFKMTTPGVRAGYEDSVLKALEADGRLKLVDRANLARVLAERKLLLANGEDPGKPIVAADVFVFLYVATEGTQGTLLVQAVHGPTAAVLGELRLPIPTAHPSEFTPPLDRQVAQWWPGVLKALKDAREKPIWTLVGVYPAERKAAETAAAVERSLAATAGADETAFFASRFPLGTTQQEKLLWVLGMSKESGGRFCARAVYLVEAKVTSPSSMELRIRQGDLQVADRVNLSKPGAEELPAAAAAWLREAMARHRRKPEAERKALRPDADDWGREQARLEFALGMEVEKRFNAGPNAKALGARNVNLRVQMQEEAQVCFRRAAQLDPTWDEPAAKAASPGVFFKTGRERNVEGLNRAVPFMETIDACRRFLATFPRSKYRNDVWSWLVDELDKQISSAFVQGDSWDEPIDGKQCFRLWFAAHAQWGQERVQALPAKVSEYEVAPATLTALQYDWFARHAAGDYSYAAMTPAQSAFEFYGFLGRLQHLSNQFRDEYNDKMVKEWADRFDQAGNKAPRSDFVRLCVLEVRKDREGYLKVLRALQKEMPDPNHAQWVFGSLVVYRGMHSLFDLNLERDSFMQWLQGKRGPGDLPYRGYDPNSQPRTMPSLRDALRERGFQ